MTTQISHVTFHLKTVSDLKDRNTCFQSVLKPRSAICRGISTCVTSESFFLFKEEFWQSNSQTKMQAINKSSHLQLWSCKPDKTSRLAPPVGMQRCPSSCRGNHTLPYRAVAISALSALHLPTPNAFLSDPPSTNTSSSQTHYELWWCRCFKGLFSALCERLGDFYFVSQQQP